jgi:hypothetical protein
MIRVEAFKESLAQWPHVPVKCEFSEVNLAFGFVRAKGTNQRHRLPNFRPHGGAEAEAATPALTLHAIGIHPRLFAPALPAIWRQAIAAHIAGRSQRLGDQIGLAGRGDLAAVVDLAKVQDLVDQV